MRTANTLPSPSADGFSQQLRSDAFYVDPYPTYRRLRDEAPFFHDPESGIWFVSRHEDVAHALTTPALYSSSAGNALQDSPLRVGRTLGSMDPPRHDELRAIMVRGFNPRRTAASKQPFEQAIARRLAELGAGRECDLVADITRPVILEALGRMLGLDEEASRRAVTLQGSVFHHTDGPLGAAMSPANFAAVFALLQEQLSRRRREPSDDLFSVLLQAQSDGLQVSDDEIVANLSTVLLAGAASIGHFAPNLLYALWAHPDQRRRLLDDPRLADSAIDEAVRWDTSTHAFARIALADISLHGLTAPRGARIGLLYASANRDERIIERPDDFDMDRGRVRHFGFGAGPHHCLGASTAREFCRILLAGLLPALGDYHLDISRSERVRHLMVRGFVSVPISW